MFLCDLPRELVKPYLDLANTLIHTDGVVEESESSILQLYATELNLDRLPNLDIVDFANALSSFAGLTQKVKKEVYFELFSLSYADSSCSDEERALLDKSRQALGISKQDAEMIENITIKLLFDYEQLGTVING